MEFCQSEKVGTLFIDITVVFHTFDMPFDLLLIVQYMASSTPPTSKSHSIYNVDSNTKSSNYMKIRFKALIYFELQETSK